MPLIDTIWDLPDDPHGNVQHIAEHGITPLDVEHVLNNPDRRETSRSSGMPMVFWPDAQWRDHRRHLRGNRRQHRLSGHGL